MPFPGVPTGLSKTIKYMLHKILVKSFQGSYSLDFFCWTILESRFHLQLTNIKRRLRPKEKYVLLIFH